MTALTEEELSYIRRLGGCMTALSGNKTETSFDDGDYFLLVEKSVNGYEAWITDSFLRMKDTLSVGTALGTTITQAYHNAVVALRKINDKLEERL